MLNNIIYSYDFEIIDNDLLNHISRLYFNDLFAFIHLTNVISYHSIIEETLLYVNRLPKEFSAFSIVLNSSATILSNLYSADIIKESIPPVKNDILPNLVLQPLLSNLISNYNIIPYLSKTNFYHLLHLSEEWKNIDKIINIIYESCHQFATDGEIKL